MRDDRNAQYVTGVRYFGGRGVLEDMDQAFEWLTLSADQGDVEAQYMLAMIYLTINPPPQKIKSLSHQEKQSIGVMYLMKASDQGHKVASSFLKKITTDSE